MTEKKVVKNKFGLMALIRFVALLTIVIFACGSLCVAAESVEERPSYYYYIRQYEDAQRPAKEVVADVTKFTQNNGGGASIYSNLEGSAKGVSVSRDYTELTFSVNVPETGLYNMEMTYFPLASSDIKMIFGVLIDGVLPYTEANTCVLSRVYRNGEIRQDEKGNDIRPKTEQVSEWRTQFLYDQTGINGNLSFYLKKGEHKITLCFDGIPLLIEQFKIKQEPYTPSYQDYVSFYKQQGYTETKDVLKLYQAEDYYLQSDSVLWPDADRTSLLTQPFDFDVIKINIGGGAQWKTPGQWISWKIDVPEDGFYNIGLKYRQNYLDGLFSSRKISIDGEVPFEEFNAMRFNYAGSWENMLLGNEYNPYSIYLTKGEHIITMENVIGDMSSTMGVLQTCIDNLNDIYLSIIMISGNDPDIYRDYFLGRQLPDLPDKLKENADLLFAEAKKLIEITGGKGSETAVLEDIAYNLMSYAEDVEDFTHKDRIGDLKDDINSLSSKLSTYQEQALDIDYIALVSSNMEMPRCEENFWEWLKFQAGMFMASFKDYEIQKENAVKVWVSTGTDQFQIMKDMINDLFTPQTGIEVDLELVQGTLVQATVAGKGPDVVVSVDADTVMNLALRGALEDLSQFDGYQELVDQYIEGSDIPFTLENGVYAVPNDGSFSVMFVRTDVFKRLGLEVPTTWDEMYDVAQVLQRNNMTLGTVPNFATLLYQNGGTYFDEDLTKVIFDENVSVEAFKQYTEFYTKYDFPVTYNFVTRFRTGEMPIGIAAYGTYNSLKYSAPEISGLWEMYPIPGTVLEDGSIDRTQAIAASTGVTSASTATVVANGGAGTIMFKNKENKDAAWEFVKWWSDAEAQSRYARDLEAVMGVSARYNTTNLKTLDTIAWTKGELDMLKEQIEHIEYVPIVPGNYYVTRGVENTYRGVVNHDENVRERLNYWTVRINEEIDRKRQEFKNNN